MKKNILVISLMILVVSCTGKKGTNEIVADDEQLVEVSDSVRPDTLHHPSMEEFDDDHMPPPPPDGDHFDGPPPPPDGDHFDGPPPPPHHGEGDHEPDNMRGFDPASEDDMEDNGMSRYMENNDEEGWN